MKPGEVDRIISKIIEQNLGLLRNELNSTLSEERALGSVNDDDQVSKEFYCAIGSHVAYSRYLKAMLDSWHLALRSNASKLIDMPIYSRPVLPGELIEAYAKVWRLMVLQGDARYSYIKVGQPGCNGNIEPRLFFTFIYFLMLTIRRQTSHKATPQLLVSGISSIGKTVFFSHPLSAISSHVASDSFGVGSWHFDKIKSVAHLSDFVLAKLFSASILPVIRKYLRTEVQQIKIFGKSYEVNERFWVLITSNCILNNFYDASKFVRVKSSWRASATNKVSKLQEKSIVYRIVEITFTKEPPRATGALPI